MKIKQIKLPHISSVDLLWPYYWPRSSIEIKQPEKLTEQANIYRQGRQVRMLLFLLPLCDIVDVEKSFRKLRNTRMAFAFCRYCCGSGKTTLFRSRLSKIKCDGIEGNGKWGISGDVLKRNRVG